MSPGQLNAGPALTVTGPGTVSVPNIYGGEYYLLDANIPSFLFMDTDYTVSGQGGSSVGAFTAQYVTSTPSAYFTGITAAQTVPLTSDLTLQWTGGDSSLQNGQVIIGGYSPTSSGAAVSFQCTAPVAAHSFTIPAWVLSLLPPSASEQDGGNTFPLGRLYIGQYNNPVAFQATGLDRGLVTDIFYHGYGVYFK
jgi:hypothetical protein